MPLVSRGWVLSWLRVILVVIPQAGVAREADAGLAGVTVWGGHGWLFENCTVDASIFVVKLLRAHGGCLGIRSR
jgi:hypothetical protein